MGFKEAKDALDSAKKADLEVLLEDWSKSRGVAAFAAQNLQNDEGSNVHELKDYLHTICDNKADLETKKPSLKIVFEKIGKPFSLAGHVARPFADAVFGRAMLLENYARYLVPQLDLLGCFDTAENVLQTLRELAGREEKEAPTRYRPYLRAIRHTALGKNAIFATFVKPIALSQSPWEAPIPEAGHIRNRVALGEDPENKDYVLFTYRLPKGVQPKVPTSASPGWSYQKWFRPNPLALKELHGWTEPLVAGLERMPEIVHSEIDGSQIVFPIQIANA